MRPVRTLIALAVLAIVAGCASTSQAGNAFDRERADEIRIEVQNHNFSDATVWAIEANARRTRLGTVTGKTDEVFTLPWDLPQRLSLEIDLVAGDRCTTRNLDVDPGDLLELQIQATFRESDFCR